MKTPINRIVRVNRVQIPKKWNSKSTIVKDLRVKIRIKRISVSLSKMS